MKNTILELSTTTTLEDLLAVPLYKEFVGKIRFFVLKG